MKEGIWFDALLGQIYSCNAFLDNVAKSFPETDISDTDQKKASVCQASVSPLIAFSKLKKA